MALFVPRREVVSWTLSPAVETSGRSAAVLHAPAAEDPAPYRQVAYRPPSETDHLVVLPPRGTTRERQSMASVPSGTGKLVRWGLPAAAALQLVLNIAVPPDVAGFQEWYSLL